MPNEKPNLSRDEFLALLQSSVTLEARRGADRYSKDELLAAARELQIDPAVANELVDAYVAHRNTLELSPRPFDTRIQLSTRPDEFDLTIPPLRLNARALAPLCFVAFWFAFIGFWTHGALRGGGLFAAFSIPFWAAGIGMVGRFGLPLLQTTRLLLNRDSGTLRTSPVGRTRTLRTPELKSRIGDHERYRHQGMAVERQPAKALLLEHGTQTMPLLDGYSEQEQKWIASELQAWLLSANPTVNLPGRRPAG
jgi:hypothetical protein